MWRHARRKHKPWTWQRPPLCSKWWMQPREDQTTPDRQWPQSSWWRNKPRMTSRRPLQRSVRTVWRWRRDCEVQDDRVSGRNAIICRWRPQIFLLNLFKNKILLLHLNVNNTLLSNLITNQILFLHLFFTKIFCLQ